MGLILFFLVSAAILFVGYVTVGAWISRLFDLSDARNTPAHCMRDGVDYEPASAAYLLPQHYSAIAAAGPIVGPIMAGVYFGWGPTWLWIIIGSIFIGGIHDFTALIASVRHQAQSIAEVVRQHVNSRAHLLFLIFIWMTLIYVIVAFLDVTAATFVQTSAFEDAQAPGPAVATSSILYLGLAVIMGGVLRITRMSTNKATAIFLPLVMMAIVAGLYIPLDISSWFAKPQMIWGYALLLYCFGASMAPVWLLLQPRGNLGGYFLYAVMIVAGLGVLASAVTGAHSIQAPLFTGWRAPENVGNLPLFPMLFITVACGACSGFHSIVASGTTSKQLDREKDARVIGYGGMLLEALFACLSLATVMILAKPAGKPDAIYASGIADFARQIVAFVSPIKGELGADTAYGILYQFALLCFATFVFDTLDASTRLARYVLMEAFGWKSRGQAALATLLTLAFPALLLAVPPVTVAGAVQPLWRVFWGIFGSSNQLLAALTLLSVTIWLAQLGKAWWPTFLPTVFMLCMTIWSLVLGTTGILKKWNANQSIEALTWIQLGVMCILLFLSVWLVAEALIALRGINKRTTTPA